MVHFEHPENYTMDEVAKWLTAIGLGSKIDNFKESGVDGSMLVILSEEDFDELGLSGLQEKKLLKSLEFSKSIAEEGNKKQEVADDVDSEELVQQLRDENDALRAQIAEYQQREEVAPVVPSAPAVEEAGPLPVPVPVPEELEPEPQGPSTYAMREKLLSIIGDNQKINKMTDGRRRGRGEPAFIANNRVLRLRETFELQNLDGQTLYQIQERKMRARDAMAIHDGDGEKVAEIKKKVIGIVRDNYVVKIRGKKEDWKIHGSILEHDFTILEDGEEIVTVHKRWIAPIRDCYMIDINEGVDEGLALCVCIALESMSEG